MKAKTYNRRKFNSDPFDNGRRGRPLVHITLTFAGIALLVIYASLIAVVDFNDNIRRNMRVFKSNSRDYQAYKDFLNSSEAEERAKRSARG